MRVKYIGVNDENGVRKSSTSHLTLNADYVVIELESPIAKAPRYRLVDDSENCSPALYPAAEFKIVTTHVPSNWVITIGENGLIITNGPAPWVEAYFWENFYDGDPKAFEIYRRELQFMYREEGYL